MYFPIIIIIIIFLNHYAPVSQTNWCNMTFTAGNLFPLIHALGDPSQSPPGFEPGSPDWEVDDLPTELSLPPIIILITIVKCKKGSNKWNSDCDSELINKWSFKILSEHILTFFPTTRWMMVIRWLIKRISLQNSHTMPACLYCVRGVWRPLVSILNDYKVIYTK